jgi:hypothetical protein
MAIRRTRPSSSRVHQSNSGARRSKSIIRKSKPIAVKSTQLASAAPHAVAHRATSISLAAPQLSDRDRKESQRAVGEKHAAPLQAWSDLAIHAFRANQAFTASMFRLFFTPFLYN